MKREYNFEKLRKIFNKERNDGLHIACEKGHDKVVKTIMKMGHKAEAVNKQMMNALHIAVKEKQLKCVKVILSYTENNVKQKTIKARDIHDEDTIMIGIKKRQKAIVHELLTEHKNFGFKDNDKKELMNCCAEFGDVHIMESLFTVLQVPKSLVDESLHFAIRSNQEETVKFLIRKKADINSRDEVNDILPLELAVKSGHSDIVRILQKEKSLEWDKFHKKQNELNVNLIHYAVRSGKYQMITDLNELLSSKHPQLCTKMLSGKEYEDGNTPLHEACDTDSKLKGQDIVEMVKIYDGQQILLHELKNDKNQSPLHLAAKCGRMEHVKALLGDDGNELLLDSEDVDSNRAVHTAAENRQPEVFEFLLKASKDHKPVNSYGKSPLHVIAESGSEKCLDILVGHVEDKVKKENSVIKKINVNTKDSQGNTSLHLASRNGHKEIVENLLKLGASVVLLDQKGKNALQIAIDSQQEKIVETIIESDCWKESLRAGFAKKDGFSTILDTPMRQLIRDFPEAANTVLEKCKVVDTKNKSTTYINEFLEDTYKYRLTKENEDELYIHVTEEKKAKKDRGGDFIEPYTKSGDVFFENHPLMTINDYKQQKLLMHDVTINLINTKWKSFGIWCYYLNLAFYCCFLGILTTNVMTSIWPQEYPALYSCSPYFEDNVFTNPNQTYVLPETVLKRDSWNYASRVLIWIFAVIRLVSIILGHEINILLKVMISYFYSVMIYFLIHFSLFGWSSKEFMPLQNTSESFAQILLI